MSVIRPFSVALVTTGLLSAAISTGCVARPKPAPAVAAPSAEQLESIRTAYKGAFPNARVGAVTAVLANPTYALVSDLDGGGVKPGDVITFVGGDEAVVANGTVVKVDPDGVTVRYDAGKRAPVVGDAAVRF